MAAMTRRLPNLNQLRAFEAAARHLSFKNAAEELHVTHAAISHQIKALEEDLGRPLFRRLTRKVELLPEAADLAERLAANLDDIAEAVARIREEKSKGHLKISAVPAFGYRFVLPRLPDFHATHPGLEVELDLQAGLADLDGGGFDAGLRYGGGDWPGLDTRLIFRDTLAPLCAPAFLADRQLPLDPAEIATLPFAVSRGANRDWQSWCRTHGLDNPPRPAPLMLENRAVVLDYTVSGSGIALVDLRFAAKELETGQLICLHPTTVRGVNGTYLAWPRTPVADPRLLAFGDWLADQTATMEITVNGEVMSLPA